MALGMLFRPVRRLSNGETSAVSTKQYSTNDVELPPSPIVPPMEAFHFIHKDKLSVPAVQSTEGKPTEDAGQCSCLHSSCGACCSCSHARDSDRFCITRDNDRKGEEKDGEASFEEEKVQDKEEGDESSNVPISDISELKAGDHVYFWMSPFVQQHGIIMTTSPEVTMSYFYPSPKDPSIPLAREVSLSNVLLKGKGKNIFKPGKCRIYKVRYSADLVSRLFRPAGAATVAPSDDPRLVLERARFLLRNSTSLPPYHALSCNSECLSVFCSTGRFLTLQVSSLIHLTSVSQPTGAVITGGILAASTTTVTVPAVGVWGLLGMTTTTTVPLVATQPWILPVLAIYGVAALIPFQVLRRWRNKWKEIERDLNQAFWKQCDPAVLDDLCRDEVKTYFWLP